MNAAVEHDHPLRPEDPLPIARVLGSPVHELPTDLYIPPDALEVFLETFEGPLDLLLYLIRREGLSIVDIPVAEITRQYIAYIEMMTRLNIELAAEYLLMAAILAEIKSRLLLPRTIESDSEEDDPRADLIRRLQDYEQFKAAALELDQLNRLERDVHAVDVDTATIKIRKRYPEVALEDLLRAFQEVLKRADQMAHHHISREPLSVRERMTRILEHLHRQSVMPFLGLFEPEEGRAGAVVALLAILEMSKERMIEILQEGPMAPIEIRVLQAITP